MTRTIVFTLGVCLAGPAGYGGETRVSRRFFDAIRTVETGSQPAGGKNAVGDLGRSIGPYQIQRAYWRDSGITGRYESVHERRYAERVMIAYWQKYCPEALARGDVQTLARVHNGGPGGERNPATWKYWQKVKHILESL
jgi:hypothetical protein